MLAAAGTGVAFRAKPLVAEAARFRVDFETFERCCIFRDILISRFEKRCKIDQKDDWVELQIGSNAEDAIIHRATGPDRHVLNVIAH